MWRKLHIYIAVNIVVNTAVYIINNFKHVVNIAFIILNTAVSVVNIVNMALNYRQIQL